MERRLRDCDDFGSALLAARTGEPAGFEWLFRRFGRPVKAFVTAKGHRDVDDIVSEAFAAAFRSIGSFAGNEDQFVSWLFRIAHNKLVDHSRRTARRPATDPLEGVVVESGTNVADDALTRLGAGVAEVLQGLPVDQRDVLVLRFASDLSIEQTAAVMGRSAGAVKQLQHRAIERVKRIIEQGAVTR